MRQTLALLLLPLFPLSGISFGLNKPAGSPRPGTRLLYRVHQEEFKVDGCG